MYIHSAIHKTGVLLVIGLVTISGLHCGKDSTTNPNIGATPPELPPQSTFAIDFSDFQLIAGKVVTQAATETSANWLWSAGNVVVWNTLLTVTLAVPVASYVEAFQHEAVQQEDGSWVWSYNFRVLGVLHIAELHAVLQGVNVKWDMYITKQGEYSNFHWYTGNSNLLTTSGDWTLFMNPAEPNEFMQIDWNINPANTTGNTKYTNIIPGNPEYGAYIDFGITTNSPFATYYEVYTSSNANVTAIQWDRDAKDGRVRDPLHFGDTEWHCWDTALQDIECP